MMHRNFAILLLVVVTIVARTHAVTITDTVDNSSNIVSSTSTTTATQTTTQETTTISTTPVATSTTSTTAASSTSTTTATETTTQETTTISTTSVTTSTTLTTAASSTSTTTATGTTTQMTTTISTTAVTTSTTSTTAASSTSTTTATGTEPPSTPQPTETTVEPTPQATPALTEPPSTPQPTPSGCDIRGDYSLPGQDGFSFLQTVDAIILIGFVSTDYHGTVHTDCTGSITFDANHIEPFTYNASTGQIVFDNGSTFTRTPASTIAPTPALPDPTPLPTEDAGCMTLDCDSKFASLMASCPSGLVKEGLLDCGDAARCVEVTGDSVCYSMMSQAKCCPLGGNANCEWFEACNWESIQDLFGDSSVEIQDLWAALPTNLQKKVADVEQFPDLTVQELRAVGPALLASLRSVAGMSKRQFKGIARQIRDMSGEQLHMFLSNVSPRTFKKGFSKLARLTFDDKNAELLVGRLAGTDIIGPFRDWSTENIESIGALLAQLSAGILADFKDRVLASASNIELITEEQLIGLFEKLDAMDVRSFKKLVVKVDAEVLQTAATNWQANGQNFAKNKQRYIKKMLRRSTSGRLLRASVLV